jgi:hypothetical protein
MCEYYEEEIEWKFLALIDKNKEVNLEEDKADTIHEMLEYISYNKISAEY